MAVSCESHVFMSDSQRLEAARNGWCRNAADKIVMFAGHTVQWFICSDCLSGAIENMKSDAWWGPNLETTVLDNQ